MKLQDARENYSFYTGKVSEITRQLALGAIAVIWLFKTGKDASVVLPNELLYSLKMVIVSLILDLLQYVFGSILWGAFHRLKELEGTDESQEIIAPRIINWPTLVFFWIKTGVLAYAYWLLFSYLSCIIIQS